MNIVHEDTTYPVRALIDTASEASFIANRLKHILSIAFTTTVATISGIIQTVLTTPRKLCSIFISSPLDASLLIHIWQTCVWLIQICSIVALFTFAGGRSLFKDLATGNSH